MTRAGSRITSIAGLAGKEIGVPDHNIGTLLASALLAEYGMSPKKAAFITDPKGTPICPGSSRGTGPRRSWPSPTPPSQKKTTAMGQPADTDQGATENFPMDGYVATQAWAKEYPKTGAAFVRAIQEGQAIADTSPLAVQSAIAKYDDLPIKVTAVMAIPGFPTGSVEAPNIQRVANVCSSSARSAPDTAPRSRAAP